MDTLFINITFLELSCGKFPWWTGALGKVEIEGTLMTVGESRQYQDVFDGYFKTYDLALKFVNELAGRGYSVTFGSGRRDYALLDLLAQQERQGQKYELPTLAYSA